MTSQTIEGILEKFVDSFYYRKDCFIVAKHEIWELIEKGMPKYKGVIVKEHGIYNHALEDTLTNLKQIFGEVE